MSNPYRVYLRAADLSRIGEIRFLQLDIRLLFSDVSEWILELPADDDIVAEIEYGQGIIIERNGQVLLSGPIGGIEHTWDASNNKFVLSGPDDTVYLNDKLGLPVITGPPYSASEHDVQTGVASTVLRSYVNRNVGPGAQVARRQAGLVLATVDPLVGTTVTGRARFDNLLALMQSLALAGGDLGFRIVQSETAAQLIFEVYQPANKTASVIFSPQLGNLRSFRYSTIVAEANYIIVGGGGEGTARTFAEQGDSASITLFGRRIEQFRDRRDTTVAGELTQTATEELANKAGKTSLSISPLDTEGLAFITDYLLGDRVTVIANGAKRGTSIPPAITIQDIIREIHIVVQETGEVIQPSVGTPESGSRDLFSIFNRITKSEARLRNLERR